MLPGFRFLFAAIMLSMALLVFGLGAAALLRAAHEEFASNPSWRAAPEVMFAQQNEPARPVLAMLRVDMPAATKLPDETPATTAPAEQAAPATAEPERIAALKPEDASATEISKAETATGETVNVEVAVSESPAAGEAAPASAEMAVSGDETRAATIATAEVPLRENQAIPAQPEPMDLQVAPGADITATSIATPDGPPVRIETRLPAKVSDAKPDQSTIKKQHQARRAAEHRRLAAARARLAAQTLAAFPFGQPAPATRTR